MIDPTQTPGFASKATATPKKEAAEPKAFEKEFHRALAPPGDDPPPGSKELTGPEESPTETPNAQSSQMDPQPPNPQLLLTAIPLPTLGEVAPTSPLSADPAVAPVAQPDKASPLEALGILSVKTETALDPAALLQKVPNPQNIKTSSLMLEDSSSKPEDDDKPDDIPATKAEGPIMSSKQPGALRESPLAKPIAEIEAPSVLHLRNKLADHSDMLATKSQRLEVKIEMNPLDLGPMTMQVSQDGKEVKAHAVVENPALRLALDRAHAHLTAALSEAGMNLTNFSMESGQKFEQPGNPSFTFNPKQQQETAAMATRTATGTGLELWI